MTRQEFDAIFNNLFEREAKFKHVCNKKFLDDMWKDCSDMTTSDLLAAVETLQKIYKGMSREN